VSKGKPNSRAIALKALIQFHKTKNSPSEILKSVLPDRFSDRDKALIWDMTMGTIKCKKRLEFIAQSYIKAPITRQKPEIKAALALGFYQLTELTGVPDFAAVGGKGDFIE
jgi:hypothetical protein